MQMRTKLPIVFLVGAGALLLAALAVVVAPRAQTAFAQTPYIEVSLLDYHVPPGDYLHGGALFRNMPCVQGTQDDNNPNVCNYQDTFPSGINYKYELFRVLDGGGTEAAGNNCQGQGLGIERELSGIYDDWKTLGLNLRISRDCPLGCIPKWGRVSGYLWGVTL